MKHLLVTFLGVVLLSPGALANPMHVRGDLDHHSILAPSPTFHVSIPLHKARHLVQLLYRAALFRNADAVGLNGWTNLIVAEGYQGLLKVAEGIGGSAEFRNDIQGRYWSSQILENIYWTFFRRQVDPAGFGWIALLDNGRGAEALRGIVSSQEFYQRHLSR